MKVSINDDCTACGLCEDTCPEVFEMGDEKAVVKMDPIPKEYWDACREAAGDCPTESIEIAE